MLLFGLSGTFAFQATLPFYPSSRSAHVLQLQAKKPSHDNHQSRRSLLQKTADIAATITAATLPVTQASAAPPIAIIAEELGYFPVTNRAGETVYVPARVKRKSSEQSIKLAQHLKSIGAVMYGAYWCPHCSHQKELFGNEAWAIVPYVECSTKGFYYDSNKIASVKEKIDGFPTWRFPGNNKQKEFVSGEMPLERLVALSGFKGGFDVILEGPIIPSSGAC